MFELKFEKKALILSILLGALVITYVLGIALSPANIRKREAEIPLFPVLNMDLIGQININTSEGTLNLKKTNDTWTVLINSIYLPALESRIDSFLDHIASLKRTKVITKNPANWESFELSPAKARRIVLLDHSENNVADLIVGKAGIGERGNYVRIEGSNEVIFVDKSFNYYLNVENKYWSYIKLFPEDLEGQDIMRISIKSRISFQEEPQGQPLNYTLTLGDGDRSRFWKAEGLEDLILSNDKVDRLANSLAGFEGTEFVTDIPPDEAGFSSPSGEVLFSTVDDRVFRLMIGYQSSKEDQYYVKLDGQSYSYLAAEWRIKKIFQPIEELLEDKENN